MKKVKPKKPSEELWRTAYHEAGHAFAQWVFGFPIRSVSCVPDEVSMGRVIMGSRANGENLNLNPSRGRRQYWKDRIVMLLAGRASERHFGGRARWKQASSDCDAVADLLLRLHPPTKTIQAGFKYYNSCAEDLVKSRNARICIPFLAKLLVARKSLNGAEVKAAFRTAMETARLRWMKKRAQKASGTVNVPAQQIE